LPSDTACASAVNQGDFAIGSASSGTFAQYASPPSYGLQLDINNGAEPLNTPLALMFFMRFDANNNETIELTFIGLGNDPVSTTCAGMAHCTPENSLLATAANPSGLSAFNLDQNASGTAASFGIEGTIWDIGGSTAPISGIYSAEFVGDTPAQVLALLSNGPIPSTYSGNFDLTIVPEPATIALLGAGLACFGLIRRRQKQ
jgi:hypothetical protein